MPEDKRRIFIEIAHREYCGDYGWCLSSLIDHSLILQPLVGKVDALQDEVLRLKHPEPEPIEEKKPSRKMMGGNEIK